MKIVDVLGVVFLVGAIGGGVYYFVKVRPVNPNAPVQPGVPVPVQVTQGQFQPAATPQPATSQGVQDFQAVAATLIGGATTIFGAGHASGLW